MAQIIKTDFSDCPQIAQDFLFYMMTIKGRSVRTVEAYHVDLRLYFRYLKCIKVLRSFRMTLKVCAVMIWIPTSFCRHRCLMLMRICIICSNNVTTALQHVHARFLP